MQACVYQRKENCFRSKGQHSTWKNTGHNFVLRSMLSNAKINIIINSSHPFSVRTPWRSNYHHYHHKMVCCWENWLLYVEATATTWKAITEEGNENFTDKTSIKWIREPSQSLALLIANSNIICCKISQRKPSSEVATTDR